MSANDGSSWDTTSVSYSLSVKQALTLGLIQAGCEVLDIGLALSPTAYFAQFDLEAPCVAMVTAASHNGERLDPA